MKTVILSAIGILFLTGCSSTVTVGPNANKSAMLGVNASTDGASVTVPWVKASVDNQLDSLKKKK